jgi:hypothetical protein
MRSGTSPPRYLRTAGLRPRVPGRRSPPSSRRELGVWPPAFLLNARSGHSVHGPRGPSARAGVFGAEGPRDRKSRGFPPRFFETQGYHGVKGAVRPKFLYAVPVFLRNTGSPIRKKLCKNKKEFYKEFLW